ncbi:hypothetical protein ACLX1H_010627 [Fusarium chlamydosporum]
MLIRDAEDDHVAVLEEINAVREHNLGMQALQQPATFDNEDAEHLVPDQDETYRGLGNTLIPHARIPNMFLLRFTTFDGRKAYQPCFHDIELFTLHRLLSPVETTDPVFSAARDWSCILQAVSGLPKEVRWVLTVIYNFACVMLRPELDEDTHWRMRPWLLHWYNVADRLFLKYGIFATAPNPD